MQGANRILQTALMFLLLWTPQTEAQVACEMSVEMRQQVAARYVAHKCAKGVDFLTCVAAKGFRCELAANGAGESYWCVKLGTNGRVEGLITYSRQGWTGTLNWMTDFVQ